MVGAPSVKTSGACTTAPTRSPFPDYSAFFPPNTIRNGIIWPENLTIPRINVEHNTQLMAALGYNPLLAIQIALAGQAADMVKQHDGPTPPEE